MKTRDTYGTPYTIGEARLAAADVPNAYHREVMQWLVRSVDALASIIVDATANLEAKSDRAHRMHVAKLYRDRMTAVVDAESLERARACARCEGDGEVSHGSCSVPDCEHAEQCPVCGGRGRRPTDDEIAALRTDRDVTDAELAVAKAELAAYKERRDRPHPFDEPALLATVVEAYRALRASRARISIDPGDTFDLEAAVGALVRAISATDPPTSA